MQKKEENMGIGQPAPLFSSQSTGLFGSQTKKDENPGENKPIGIFERNEPKKEENIQQTP